MMNLCVPLIILISTFVLVHCGDHVTVIDGLESLKARTSRPEKLIVFFHTEKCAECPQKQKVFENVADLQAAEASTIEFAVFDASNEKYLHEFSVFSFPSIVIFENGETFNFDEDINAESIKKFIRKKRSTFVGRPVKLTSANFSSFINSQPLVMVEFFAPWCGHCQKLVPEYEKAADLLSKADPPLPIATVDCTEETDLALLYDIKGYPTLKIFRRGKPTDYEGDRSGESITVAMMKANSYAPENVNSIKDLERHFSGANPFLLAIHNENEEFVLAVKSIGIEFQNLLTTLLSSSPALIQHFKVKPNVILIIKPKRFNSIYESDYDIFTYKGEGDAEIIAYIKSHMFPLLGHYTLQLAHYYDEMRDKPLCLFFYDIDFEPDFYEETQSRREHILFVVHKFKNSIRFAIAGEQDWPKLLKESGVEDTGVEMSTVCFSIKNGKKRRYVMEAMDIFDPYHIETFMKNFIAGKLKPFPKSAISPARYSGPFCPLVAFNFEDNVFNGKHDSIVYFYDNTCSRCPPINKEVEEEVKKILASYKSFKVYKFELSENDRPEEFTKEEQQAIYFIAKGNKKAIHRFNGNLENTNEVKQFITKHLIGKDEL